MQGKFLFLILLLLLTVATGNNGKAEELASSASSPGCLNCHKTVKPDTHHAFSCKSCHLGDSTAKDKSVAHNHLLATPAAPATMERVCGKCHQKQVKQCRKSLHFTLKNAVNKVRAHFGILPELQRFTQLPALNTPPANNKELINDMLRRRCLRCHVYTAGDQYPLVERGQGCAACHLQYADGKPVTHAFIKPTQQICLSCHYANHVGSDFLGAYEHDFNWEYRTPYTRNGPYSRPYGVELHNLSPDIHSTKGMTCLDCHYKEELAGTKPGIRCIACHAPDKTNPLPGNVVKQGSLFFLYDRQSGQKHQVPQLIHPAHAQYNRKVACQVCHAQWAFNDQPTHLVLSFLEDADPWERLTVQSSSAVEHFLDHNLNSDDEELSPAMNDTISGSTFPGIWYKGFGQRRWESLHIQQDVDGIIKVFRPILDLRVSAIDEDEIVLFDTIKGKNSGLLPYTPHTTGPAGIFYERRFLHFLHSSNNPPAVTR